MLWKNALSPELFERIVILQKDKLFNDYFLAGGTALALQTGYRRSVDIDLFAFKKQNNETFINYFKDNFKDVRVINDDGNILNLMVCGVKTDVCGIRGKPLEPPVREEGVVMFGLKDISAMKLSAICGRKRAKDYADIAYLLDKGVSLKNMFEYYKEKYNENDAFHVKKALTEYNLINPYEWESVKILDSGFFASNVPSIIKHELIKYNDEQEIGKRGILKKIIKPRGVKNKDNPGYDMR